MKLRVRGALGLAYSQIGRSGIRVGIRPDCAYDCTIPNPSVNLENLTGMASIAAIVTTIDPQAGDYHSSGAHGTGAR